MGKPKYNKAGRYQDGSSLNQQKGRHAPVVGYVRDGQPWTADEDNRMLDAWLALDLPLLAGPGRNSMVEMFKRSPKSIRDGRVWKLATRYPSADYQKDQAQRTDRTGRPFNERDVEIIEWSLGTDGKKRQADEPSYIAGLLGRSEAEVRDYLQKNYLAKPVRKGLNLCKGATT